MTLSDRLCNAGRRPGDPADGPAGVGRQGEAMQMFGGLVLILAGVALCAWSVLSSGVSWGASGLHVEPRFWLGHGWTLGGVVIMVRVRRRGGPGKW